MDGLSKGLWRPRAGCRSPVFTRTSPLHAETSSAVSNMEPQEEMTAPGHTPNRRCWFGGWPPFLICFWPAKERYLVLGSR